MNMLNVVKKSLTSLLAIISVAAPSFSSDIIFDVQQMKNKSADLTRYNFYVGPEQIYDRTSTVYNSAHMIMDFPNMPYFAPYNPNNEGQGRLNNGITSFPLVIRLPGDLFGGNLPQSLIQQLQCDGIIAENLTIGVVAQNIPFEATTQLCFRPHTFIYPTIMVGRTYDKPVSFGIFEREKNKKNNLQNTTTQNNVSIHPDKNGETVLSPDNMHLSDVSHKRSNSLYTYTRYVDGAPRAIICLHLLLKDKHHNGFVQLVKDELAKSLPLKDFIRVLSIPRKEFKGSNGLSRICDLLKAPKKFVVPLKPRVPEPAIVACQPEVHASQTPKPAAPAAQAPIVKAATINLLELMVNGNKLIYNEHNKGFIGQGSEIQVKLGDFTAPVNGVGDFKLKIVLTRPASNDINCDLILSPLKAEFDKKFSYRPEKDGNITPFVEGLLKNKYPGLQRFKASLNVTGLGAVSFQFSRPRNLVYSKTTGGYSSSYSHKYSTHETVYEVRYGFEGDSTADSWHVLCNIQHDAETVVESGKWYMDGLGRLCQVGKVTYSYPPKTLEKWYEQNGLSSRITYSEFRHDTRGLKVVYPPSSWFGSMTPDKAFQEKYYKTHFSPDLEKEDPTYIYADNENNLWRVQLWKWWLDKLQLRKENNSAGLLDMSVDPVARAAVLKGSEMLLPRSGNGLIQRGHFKEGFYKLEGKQECGNQIIQRWVDDSDKTEVTVSISGVRENGRWLPLKGLPQCRPISINGKTILDLSEYLGYFTEANWDSLKDHLLALFWVERKLPVLKYHYPSRSFDSARQVGEKLTWLINSLDCFELNIDGGWFLVKEPTGKWTIIPNQTFCSKARTYKSLKGLALFSSHAAAIIENANPSITEFDITGIQFKDRNLPAFLANSPLIRSITTNKIDAKHLGSLALSDAEVINFVGKAKSLSVVNMSGFSDANLKPQMLLNCFVSNRGTLDTLDISGLASLGSLGDDIVKTIATMGNLRVLKMCGTNFSNDQIVALSNSLEKAVKLQQLELDMPYSFAPIMDPAVGYAEDAWRDSDGFLGKVALFAKAAFSPVVVGVTTCITVPASIVAPFSDRESSLRIINYGTKFREVFDSLQKIQNLNSLKMKVFDIIKDPELLSNLFNKQRQEKKLAPVEVVVE